MRISAIPAEGSARSVFERAQPEPEDGGGEDQALLDPSRALRVGGLAERWLPASSKRLGGIEQADKVEAAGISGRLGLEAPERADIGRAELMDDVDVEPAAEPMGDQMPFLVIGVESARKAGDPGLVADGPGRRPDRAEGGDRSPDRSKR